MIERVEECFNWCKLTLYMLDHENFFFIRLFSSKSDLKRKRFFFFFQRKITRLIFECRKLDQLCNCFLSTVLELKVVCFRKMVNGVWSAGYISIT
ncbi:hypothetical protein HYPBUDRAFT_188590 [Hyphopichia burtonii NRRL Y-1933]|uniref:Uncharacterized protein n=1 Tax=Hyphopichia burtonii NRRL Y-1933 TaxID=984485 RepID=A0A1E4RMZ0_9ASCO|nr:hypothetical protein HYPBUDRAFT_188590 [Hyphopichia burtonii NRRL Y-1933]ODV68465.1 hypothetical protein HYPBUDRAFT_188590 [Hyphopichia burtonii NRRL Y-1933]